MGRGNHGLGCDAFIGAIVEPSSTTSIGAMLMLAGLLVAVVAGLVVQIGPRVRRTVTDGAADTEP